MLIKHPENAYSLELKESNNVVVENVNGKQTEEIFNQFWDDYKKIIKPLNGKSWAKKAVMDEFSMASSVDEELLNSYLKWSSKNGLKCVAMVVGSAVVKMKMNRLLKQSVGPIETQAFADEKEADKWLREKGF